MHLLIDQSRKGSAPPTLRPPLPSVNHSRNNLMIGAPVRLSRLPRRAVSHPPFVSGTIMTPRFGKSFSSSHAPLLRLCSQDTIYMPGRRKRRPAPAPDIRRDERRDRLLRTREYSLISRSSGYIYSWQIRRATCAYTLVLS